MPAMMPTRSCSPPRVAETVSTWEGSNDRGSEPNFSTLARPAADSAVKPPRMIASPLVIRLWAVAADSTLPSRTIANMLRGSAAPTRAPVSSDMLAVPSVLKLSVTAYCSSPCGMPNEAVERS